MALFEIRILNNNGLRYRLYSNLKHLDADKTYALKPRGHCKHRSLPAMKKKIQLSCYVVQITDKMNTPPIGAWKCNFPSFGNFRK